MRLANATGALLVSPITQTVTITDNDPLPALSINDVAIAEGAGGATNFNFTVTLSAASGRTVTVAYATADGSATAGSDYTATSGTLTFTPGQTSKVVPVSVIGDSVYEANETFTVNLTAPGNATISRSQGVGTILSDDLPSLSVDDVRVNEGSGTAVFTVTTLLVWPAVNVSVPEVAV